jgi:uncharacterized protein
MIRVVADTNVLISALMFGGLPGTFLELVVAKSISLVTSVVLLDELEEKLWFKFHMSADDAKLVRRKLATVAEVITPAAMLHVIVEDPDDDRVLECAIEGSAQYVVSGDRHLLKLGSYASIPIVTVRQFINLPELAGS